jgi:uncharacterized membrane protein YeaQ/YmgE (transglycosylase-associated protein family)
MGESGGTVDYGSHGYPRIGFLAGVVDPVFLHADGNASLLGKCRIGELGSVVEGRLAALFGQF